MPSSDEADIDSLRARWNHLYASHLPALAEARDPVQPRWTVHLDHCFARIILDNAVGISKPWNQVVKAPAVRNMTAEQLHDALALGEKLANGEADLAELDQNSLSLRGKKGNTKPVAGGKRKTDGSISKYFATSEASPQNKRVKTEPHSPGESETKIKTQKEPKQTSPPKGKDPDMAIQISRIASAVQLTDFRKQTLTLLCKIPRGRYSTYQAMSDYISATSHKTCARAVGNAMRNNPFAPEVPCHRILSSDGTIGGFKGSWGEEGKYATLKKQLLREEGVVFDSSGKVKGPPYRFET